MASQWFYQVMGEQVGPVSSSDLRNLAQHGTLSADTLVRKAPSSDWVLAERVQGLLSTPTATTPHPPVTVPAEKRPSAKAPLAGTAGSQPNKQPATSERDNSEANPTTKRFSPVLIATAVLGSLALVVLVAILITAHKSPTVDAMQTEPSVLSVNGTVLKVRVWSNVLYQAAGKGEDPTESFIRQAKAIESAVKETERLGHVVEKDSDAVNEAARVRNATMDEAVAASNRGNSTLADSLEQKADGLNTDWEEKHKQYDRDCQRFDDWGKHIDEMKKKLRQSNKSVRFIRHGQPSLQFDICTSLAADGKMPYQGRAWVTTYMCLWMESQKCCKLRLGTQTFVASLRTTGANTAWCQSRVGRRFSPLQ